MADEPSWDEIFRPGGERRRPAVEQPSWQPTVDPDAAQSDRVSGLVDVVQKQSVSSSDEPLPSRREVRGGRRGGAGASGPGATGPIARPKKKKRRAGPIILLVILLAFVGTGAGGAWYVWDNYEDQVREVLGIELPNDYTGSGNGTEVTVVITSGDIGEDVARTLEQAGVTMTFDAFYDLLLTSPDVTFEPGNYALQEEMSAASALAALQDPANKLINQVTIPEGTVYPDALELIAAGTEIPLKQLRREARDYEQFGIPAKFPSIEGWLFPATYTFDPDVTASEALQTMVDRMTQELTDQGVARSDWFEILTMAGLVQREAGNEKDMPKIAAVFYNRLDQGINLESDATVAYGTGNLHTVWTTGDERADASNLYNTYANPGLPIGPIGLPGSAAIDAAVNPADGDWLFFVPVNLKTGKTVFSTTAEEHEANAQRLRDWCNASAENLAYCE